MQQTIVKLNLLFLLTVASCSTVLAGLAIKDSTHQTLSGIIVDAHLEESIPMAHIVLPDQQLASISNSDGRFLIKVPADYFPCTLHISSIGFESKTITVRQAEDDLQIELKACSYTLDEVLVQPLDILALIRSAIDMIPKNYSKKNSLYRAYYQETYKGNGEYLRLQDYILDAYRTESSGNDSFQIVSLKRRSKVDTSLLSAKGESFHSFQWGLTPYSIIEHNDDPTAAMNGVGFNDKRVRKMNFDYKLYEDEGREDYYVIEMNDRKRSKRKGSGILVIEKSSLAILSIQWEYAVSVPVFMRTFGVKSGKSGLTLIFNKGADAGSLLYASQSFDFGMGKVDYSATQSILVTEIENANVSLPDSSLHMARSKENLSFGLSKDLDLSTLDTHKMDNDRIWDDYNIIPPNNRLKEFLNQ